MVAAAFDRMTVRARREAGLWLTIAAKDKNIAHATHPAGTTK